MTLSTRKLKILLGGAICLLFFGARGSHAFQQSSYALIEIVEDGTPASAADGRRLAVNQSVFDSDSAQTAVETTPPASDETIQLDFTSTGFGDSADTFSTGSSAFGSNFDAFEDDTSEETLEIDLNDLQVEP